MKPITIKIFRKDPKGGWTAHSSDDMRAGTWSKAEAKAAEVLGEIKATRYTYSRDAARGNFAELTRGKRVKRYVYPAIHIVPSVSELGWTP